MLIRGSGMSQRYLAAADYALNKALALPDYCGRGMFFMDNMGAIAAKNRIDYKRRRHQ